MQTNLVMRVQCIHSIQHVSAREWDQVAEADFPFSSYHYLAALETTDCLGHRTGWDPRFQLAWDGDRLLGALVAYRRTNSYGEYIFDFAWAQAYSYSGLSYYPKLTSAIPFTPATGPKLLINSKLEPNQKRAVAEALIQANDSLLTKENLSSAHALFIPEDQLEYYRSAGYAMRDSFQFHWISAGYKSFDDFLQTLRSKRRREILRERRQVKDLPVRIVRLTGEELKADHAVLFYDFYLHTIDKRQSFNYLTLEFFVRVFQDLRDRILLVLALDLDGRPVAGALNYFGSSTLYGRNWGCVEEYRCLHFELCYYQGIEFTIERGLTKFEAGAQGEHKFQRGFLPTLTRSAHKLVHPELKVAVENFLGEEKKQISEVIAEYLGHSPFSNAER